jgi:hypothetical protein
MNLEFSLPIISAALDITSKEVIELPPNFETMMPCLLTSIFLVYL